jgi:hypothetical protein
MQGGKMKKKTDKYEEHACEFLNEDDCKEELDEDSEDVDKAEDEHFADDKNAWK